MNADVPFDDEEEVSFHSSGTFCVCFTEIANSSETMRKIANGKSKAKYYRIFLYSIAAIARHFDAKIIKSAGDGLVWYFPCTADCKSKDAFKKVLECCITVLRAHTTINKLLERERLPPVDYRISADYGELQVAISKSSNANDLFGPTMNICAKINSLAPLNGMVIGGDLYEVIRHFSFSDDYHFKNIGDNNKNNGYKLAFIKQAYPLFSIRHNRSEYHDDGSHDDNNIIIANYWGNEGLLRVSPVTKAEQKNHHASSIIPSSVSSIEKRYGFQEKEEKESAMEANEKNELTKQLEATVNIMIIDDEEDVVFTLKEFLKGMPNCNVDTITTSEQALRKFALTNSFDSSCCYHVVIIDIRIPGMNGLELYQRLKAIERNIKVLFVTALDVDEELTSILPGITKENIMKKPIRRTEFIQRIKNLVNNNNAPAVSRYYYY
jgi:CheY-like chemotaxis protein/class 3 adenylate cyclase